MAAIVALRILRSVSSVNRALKPTSKAFTKKACLTVSDYNFTEDLDGG